MRTHYLVAAILLVSALAVNAQAQTYTIKLKTYPDAGMTVTYHETKKDTGGMKFLDETGKVLQETKDAGNEFTYTLTVLNKEPGNVRPTKYKRVYDKATEKKDGKNTDLSYQGRTVVFEKKDGKYQVGVAGKPPLDAKDLESLIEKNNDGDLQLASDHAITPAKAVAVGERWTIDPKILSTLFKKFEIDPKASKGEAVLTKVYTKGKSQFGVIECNFHVAVKGYESVMKFAPSADMDLKVTIDTAIDGSSTERKEVAVNKSRGKGLIQQGDKKVTVEIDMVENEQSERSAEKDDAKAREVPVVEFSAPGGNWAEFVSKEGRFTAQFPGKPEVSTKGTSTTTAAKQEKGNIAYMVVYTDTSNPNADAATVLAKVAEGFAKDTKEKKEIKQNGYTGIELLMEKDQGGQKVMLAYQAYIAKGRLYQVMAIASTDLKDKLEARKFLDSFKLHDKKE